MGGPNEERRAVARGVLFFWDDGTRFKFLSKSSRVFCETDNGSVATQAIGRWLLVRLAQTFFREQMEPGLVGKGMVARRRRTRESRVCAGRDLWFTDGRQ